MRIYMDQVPDGVSFEDYPPGTEFILDDAPLKRDPETFQIVREKRTLVYPEQLQ